MTPAEILKAASTPGISKSSLKEAQASAATKLATARAALCEAESLRQGISGRQALVNDRKNEVQREVWTQRLRVLSAVADLVSSSDKVRSADVLNVNKTRDSFIKESALLTDCADHLNVQFLTANSNVTLRKMILATESERWVESDARLYAFNLIEQFTPLLAFDSSLKLEITASEKLQAYCDSGNQFHDEADALRAQLNTERTHASQAWDKFRGQLPPSGPEDEILLFEEENRC